MRPTLFCQLWFVCVYSDWLGKVPWFTIDMFHFDSIPTSTQWFMYNLYLLFCLFGNVLIYLVYYRMLQLKVFFTFATWSMERKWNCLEFCRLELVVVWICSFLLTLKIYNLSSKWLIMFNAYLTCNR